MHDQKLDCLLIYPPNFHTNKDNIWKEVSSNFPPLGLAQIAGYVRSKGHSVRIIDCNISSPSVEAFGPFFDKKIVPSFSSIKVIGITSMTCNIKKAYKIAEICKTIYPNSLIVFGGVHPTNLYHEVISNKYVDVVVIGEGEITFEEILSGKKLEDISGIVFKKRQKGKEKVIITKPRERIANLDILPMPAYDLLPILKYKPAKGTYKRLPAMSMITSRGCPGRCTFCSKSLGSKIVFKSAQKIFEEIVFLKNNYGIKQILFYDDTFTVYKRNVVDLCKLLIRNKVNISWTCFARVDLIDPEMLHAMKKAGCHQIMYGVESIDEQVLININKKINLSQVISATKWTKKEGIDCRLAFMVGNPGDSLESIKKNIKFVNKLNPDLLIINITTPFPGTDMFKWAKEKNLILTYDWDDYDLARPVMKLENLNERQIKELYKIMYRSFYFRPSYIIGRILRIRSIDDVMVLFEGFKALLSFFGKKQNN
jgi:radical SAM superfamily enzyme YgiQ (UPF0313 family)